MRGGRSSASGSIAGLHTTRARRSNAACAGVPLSTAAASTPAMEMMAGKCAGSASGGRMLLARGFPTRDRQFWLGAFAQLRRHATPPSLPKYGYLLESGVRAVGAVLLICSLVR